MDDLQPVAPSEAGRRCTQRLCRSLESFRSRATEDPPTRGGLVLAYVIMLAVLAAAAYGSAFAIAISAGGASGCLPSGRPLGSSGSVTATTVVLGAVLITYCAGCAAYLWSVGAAAVHSRVWLAITFVMMGLVAWTLATADVNSCG